MTCEPAEARGPTATRASAFTLAVGLLAFANFVVVTTEFVVVGLLPVMARDLGLSLAEAGWFVTWFALSAALLGPPLTMAAARHPPREMLILTTLVVVIGNLAAVLVPHHGVLTVVRVMQGAVLPVFVSVASVAAARLAGAGREGWAISLVNTGVVAATVLGVPVGAMVAARLGWAASFAALTLLGLAAAGLIAIYFPRLAIGKRPSVSNEASLLGQPRFLMHLLLSAVLFVAMFTGYTYVAPFLVAAGHVDETAIGWMLMGFGCAGAVGNWLAGRVVDRGPLVATASVAFALALAMAAIVQVGGPSPVLFALVGLWGTAHMAAFVLSQVRVMTAGRNAPAFAMALNISVCNLGIALGALLGGRIATCCGVEVVGYGGAAIAALACLIALAMAVFQPRSRAEA